VDFDIGRSYCNYWGAVKKDCTWLQTDLQARKEMELHKVSHIAPNVGQAPGFFCYYLVCPRKAEHQCLCEELPEYLCYYGREPQSGFSFHELQAYGNLPEHQVELVSRALYSSLIL